MEPKNKIFEKFTALIILSKKTIFGLKTKSYFIWITTCFKILKVDSGLPFNQGDKLNFNMLKTFISDNHYSISFTTKNSFLKRELFGIFDGIINEDNVQKKKYDKRSKLFESVFF